jgi:hypothetical protein
VANPNSQITGSANFGFKTTYTSLHEIINARPEYDRKAGASAGPARQFRSAYCLPRHQAPDSVLLPDTVLQDAAPHMEVTHMEATMTRDDITSVLGPVDEAVIADIVSTGATVEELREAFAWIGADEALVNEGRQLPSARVAALIELLEAADDEDMP